MRSIVAGLGLVMVACSLDRGSTGPVADLRGDWSYEGTQAASSLVLSGTLSITGQSSDLIVGSLSWTESDGLGEPVVRAGAMSGVVLGESDVDFDVTGAGTDRRHVGRIVADTISGVWASLDAGISGSFRAVRIQP